VPYGELLELGRARLGGPGRLVRTFLTRILPRRWMMRGVVAAARLAGKMPKKRTAAWPAPPTDPRGVLTLHLGCLTPHVFPHLAPEAAQVFSRLGYAVEPAVTPSCCGALHRHAGLPAPEGDTTDMVSVAAGCSATPGMRDACALLLDELPLTGFRLPPVKVAYDAPCHLLHGQGVDAAPLLDAIEGVERVPLAGADRCCGAGGLYMEQQPALARAVRAEKLDAIEASGAQVVATPNPGCMIWLWRGIKQRKLDVEVVHPLSLLARASA
jgi:glycolate oxidase iron-sulfur subunit